MTKHGAMSSSSLLRVGLTLALVAASSAPAAAADVAMGEALTAQWCNQCHVVGNGSYGTDAAPPLPVIARQKSQDREWIKAWLAAPHPPMPNLNLSRQEIDDIAAYLASLSPKP